MRVRAADDLVVIEPLLRDGSEVAEGLHGAHRVEDVVDHPLEVVRVVRVRHYRRVEHGLELERECENCCKAWTNTGISNTLKVVKEDKKQLTLNP